MATTESSNRVFILHTTGFFIFHATRFQKTAPQSRHEPDFVSNDVVLETQESQKRKNKGKRAKETDTGGPNSGLMAPKPWTHDEETALERCYIDHSENKTKGNSQKRENFWKKLTGSWHEMMGYTDQEYRTYHQLNSKWKDMSAKLMRFSGIYNKCDNNRKSSMNDEGVIKWAEKEYQLKSNDQIFNHYYVWATIKDTPKFLALCQEANEGQSSSKRTKKYETNAYPSGGSDAHTNYAVNLEQDKEDDEFEI
ncbi:hypothetical protein R6Q59_020150 [Mikania micrantha]